MIAEESNTVGTEPNGGVDDDLLLRVTNVAKAFGATQAVRDASFTLRRGEVHVLVGENGCGKSTMVKILSGVHVPDSGTIEVAGEVIAPLRTPAAAQKRGIFTVFQEVLVAEACSVADNVWLGADDIWRTRVGARTKRARATEMLGKLMPRPLDLGVSVEDLSLSERQTCGLVRALLRDPRILILDEATSALDVETRDRLFEVVRELSANGVGIIFITHRMDEIERIGDRITVMRSGNTVASLNRGEWTPQSLVQLMTGSEALVGAEAKRIETVAKRRGDVVLSVEGLKLKPDGGPIDLEIRAGELIGLAGLEGMGGNEFIEALRGASPVEGKVVRHLSGSAVVLGSPDDAADCGIAYVPRERRLDSLFSWMTIRENFALPTLSRDLRAGLVNERASRRRLSRYIKQLGIRLGSPEHSITTLSGGNQQKVVVARWLAFQPGVLLLNDPTRGIDIGAKTDLYALFGSLAERGMAIVMLSTELDEHVELMDRVLVFRDQEVLREFDRSEVTRDRLVAAFFGEKGDE